MKNLIAILILGLLFCGCAEPHKQSFSRSSNYLLDKLTIEVQPINGKSLDGKEMARFKGEYQEAGICAIESITIIRNPSIVYDKTTWSLDDLENFRRRYQTVYDESATDRVMMIFMAHLTGKYESSSNVIGLAWDRDFIVFFDNYKQTNDYQSVVVMHEIGHTLGLVGVVPREKINDADPGHCVTQGCVMYPTVYPLKVFDSLCRNDIKKMIELGGPQLATKCNCKE